MTRRRSYRGRRVRQQKARQGVGWKTYALIAGVVVLAVAGFVILRAVNTPRPSEQVSLDKSKGADEAPVVVTEYGDFQ